MPETEVVSSIRGKEKAPPPVTPEARKSSDERMSKLLKHSVRFAGAVVPNSEEARERALKEKSNGEPPKEEASKTSDTPAPPTTGKADETPKKEDDKPSPESSEKKPIPTNWEEQSKSHQSRADKAESELKKFQAEVEPSYKKQIDELKIYKEQVDGFTADPMNFLLKRVPNLAKQLASAGDPVKMVETELLDFQQQLDTQFFQTYGEDWRFNETEALRPGTASFRYKLALDDRLTEIRTRYRNTVDDQKRKAVEAERSIVDDKERLKKDFGLGEEDFKKADEYVSTKQLTYYDLVKAILIDSIVQRKLDAIHPPPPITRDITSGPKGGDNLTPAKSSLSEGGRQIVARFGRRVFNA